AAGAAAGPGVAFPLPPPAVEALRNPGPLKQDPAAVREWLTPAKDVRAWIAWLATSGLQTPSLTEPWEQGKLPFVNAPPPPPRPPRARARGGGPVPPRPRRSQGRCRPAPCTCSRGRCR